MGNIKMTICKIKGIENGIIEIPIENRILAIVGSNGTGKSTIMSCLAQLVSRHNLGLLRKEDYAEDSFVRFENERNIDKWYCKDDFWIADTFPDTIRFNGTYEGSLFYGMRFIDSKIVDDIMAKGDIKSNELAEADPYIIEHLGDIIHGDKFHYKNLKRIRNRIIRDRLGLKNTPYFLEVKSKLISQYRMSSGECLLISLLHFIYNSVIRRSLPANKPILLLIDEIELALHPVAIVNLIELLTELVQQYDNLTVILTSHSPEVIRRINPKSIFMLDKETDSDNSFNVINPCYPSYAIRDIYAHDGFDYLILVEDELAKKIVKNAIYKLGLDKSALINVLPVGGWQNVLKLQYELINKNILGVGRAVMSILDGDVKHLIKKEYKNLLKFFLPVSSIEKYLLKVLVISVDFTVKKRIKDVFFNVESIDDLIKEYNNDEEKNKEALGDDYKQDSDGKRFYNRVIKEIGKRKISEEEFVLKFYDIIEKSLDFTSLYDFLKEKIV